MRNGDHRGRTAVGAFVGLILMLPAPDSAWAGRAKPAPCPDATYRVVGGPLLARDRTSDLIRVSADGVSIGSACQARDASRARVRGSRRRTSVRAKWDACPFAEAERVRFKLTVDAATCESAKGSLIFKAADGSKQKIPVVALANVGESIRIGAYNVQYLPSTVFSKDPAHAEKMSERIIASGYDFIVLTEVFDDEARDVFAERLGEPFDGNAAEYPYYISELDGDTVVAEQSGHAIFSKFPFAPVDDPGCEGEPCGGNCEGTGCNDVVFLVYHVCDDTAWPWDVNDCDSDKGMAYVRLENPSSGRIYSVFFTHTQASYPDDEDSEDEREHFETRKQQLGLMGTILNAHRPADGAREDVFLMGDLNVDGNLNNPNLGDGGEVQNRYEFDYHFDSANDFFQGFFIDPWHRENSPSGDDPGFTGPLHYLQDGGARLDYIVRHAPNSPPLTLPGERDLCFQHMTIAYNLFWSDTPGGYVPKGLGEGGQLSLSDHLGVNADVNLWAPQCRPADALVPFLDAGSPELFPGEIRHPGSLQWWRIELPGTYSIEVLDDVSLVPDPSFEMTVYKPTDLSTPVAPYKDETNVVDFDGIPIEAREFEVLEPPYYVRVNHQYRTVTGDYRFLVLKHDCASQLQSCALRPAQVKDHVLPELFTGQDEAWFDFETDKLPGGMDPQTLLMKIAAIPEEADGLYTLRLYKDDGTTLLDESTTTEQAGVGLLAIKLLREEKKQRKFYLTVTRGGGPDYEPGTETDFSVSWFTNLSILYAGSAGVTIQGMTENDNQTANDEIEIDYVEVDGVRDTIAKSIDEDFEAGEVHDVSGHLDPPIYFYDTVTVRFLEEDDIDEDDILDFVIDDLPDSDPAAIENFQHNGTFDTGGDYVLRYSLSHFLPD